MPHSMDMIGRPFDEVDRNYRAQVFGVDYIHLELPGTGSLYVTRYGWPRVRHLLPRRWHRDRAYASKGNALTGATGHVYRFPDDRRSNPFDLVVKVSRFAQEVPLVVRTSFPDDVPEEVRLNARFNSPFEEFALVNEMRTSRWGPATLRIRTKLPVGIFIPAESAEAWQLGRSRSRLHFHQHMLTQDAHAIDRGHEVKLQATHEYYTLFAWIDGINAETAHRDGDLNDDELQSLMPRVVDEMRARGFRMLDNKPSHVILRRRRRNGRLLRRNGKLTYALVDFELLARTDEYQAWLAQQDIRWPLSHRI